MNDLYRCGDLYKRVTDDSTWYEQRVRLLTTKDGKPIKLGDTVWGEDGKKWYIDAIGDKYVWGRGQHPTQKRLKPQWLTHTEPDSWERILADAMGKSVAKYCAERGLNERVPIESFYKVMVTDLVRRCEALAVQR